MMDYEKAPVTDLIRGPLLHTPQGWVVLASVALYALLALAVWLFGVSSALGKTPGVALALCFFWPLINFLMYVRWNSPYFKASWSSAAYLLVVALAPVAYAAWRLYS